jgi:uncharacterized protein YcsI (UPF0317 family)
MFKVIVKINDIHWAVDYLLVNVVARNKSKSKVLNQSNTSSSPVLHNKEVQFEFSNGEIRTNEPFYACVTILGHGTRWSVCKIGKNSDEKRPETVIVPLRDIPEYWQYAENNEADPIEDVDEDWIF